jgi:NADPH-dependent curcumin reductase CurA
MNRKWVLRHRPRGEARLSDVELIQEPIPKPGPGQMLIRAVYVSIDPGTRVWMNGEVALAPGKLGDVVFAPAIAVVEESRKPGFKKGDVVFGLFGWQEYALVDSAQKIARGPEPLTAHVSVLGGTGMTAYFGMLHVGQPKAGETVVVSSAAGATGSVAGQVAKLKGCRVIGIAGSDEKCRRVVEDFGFDACINYKKESVADALKRECPKGLDLYFENVGGAILDAALANLGEHARVVLCGLLTTYNATQPAPGPSNFGNILLRRARVEGFNAMDYFHLLPDFYRDMGAWISDGRIKYDVQVMDGIENAFTGFQQFFTGGNMGKIVLKLSDEP